MTRSVSFSRSAAVRMAAVVVAGALGWGLSGMARPAAAQSWPDRVYVNPGMQPVQLSDRERRRLQREQERQMQQQRQLRHQPWDRYQLDRYPRERRNGYGSDGLWGPGSGEQGESRGYRGFNGFKGYDNRQGYRYRGNGDLGNPRNIPGGNGG